MASRLTVITGPPGVDIGPVAAKLGSQLDDGLAIRVVRSNVTHDTPHTSPDPFHLLAGREDWATNPRVGAVRLSVLPSAWQDPQTNLGVVYDAQPDFSLTEDIDTLDALGLDPSHRLTIQSNCGSVRYVRHPAEVGDLGVQARDAVLRAGGRVQIEAGDGQTFMQALSTVGLPPWASWIGHLDRWIVLDAAERGGVAEGNNLADYLPGAIQLTVDQLDGSSGAYSGIGGMTTLRVALLNAQFLVPGIAAHDYNVSTNTGDEPAEATRAALVKLLDDVVDKTGVEIHLLGTGRIDGTGIWSWIESGEYTG